MIKSEFIAKLASKLTHLPEKTIANGVNKIISLMSDAIAENQRTEIRGFGSLSLRYHAPRNAHNPKTGEKVKTTAKYTTYFKPGKELKERINASKDKYQIIDNE